jgi:Cys-tRNA synthase (O-phospho-L-seryl-tRNA:Cys-tRNA synthase)
VEPREDVLPSSSGARSSAGRAPIGGAAMVREFITEFTRRMQRECSRK